MKGYLGAMRRYAEFRGRASRAEFWQYTAVVFVALIVALIVDAALFSGSGHHAQPLTGLVGLVHLVPNLAVAVRRLHDRDKSGWLLLLTLIPLVGLVLFIVWACQPGTVGANAFGPDPRGGTVATPEASPSAPRPVVGRDAIADIERLAQLRASGSLTEAEYEVMKAQALGQGGRA